jgi:hypothetical protein
LLREKSPVAARQLRQLTASTAADLASNVHNRTKVRKYTIASPGILALAAGIAAAGGDASRQAAWAQAMTDIDARVIALNIPGASAISQVGTFLTGPGQRRGGVLALPAF